MKVWPLVHSPSFPVPLLRLRLIGLQAIENPATPLRVPAGIVHGDTVKGLPVHAHFLREAVFYRVPGT